MNWTGLGIVFPRDKWIGTKGRREFDRPGVYILVGYEDEDDLPTLYIGQTDGLRDRLDHHFQNKDFWDWGVAFLSANNGLNRAHITWLEYALVRHAHRAARSRIQNLVSPQEPSLSESEEADTQGFLKEILQILPLVGLRAFEKPKAVAAPNSAQTVDQKTYGVQTDKDTVVVPAQRDGFERVFLGEDSWYAIRISGGMRPHIKWIAAYQTLPVSAITHVAEVDRIEPYGESGKYKLVFKGPAEKLKAPIPYGDAPSGAMQGPRYTTITKLRNARTVADVLA